MKMVMIAYNIAVEQEVMDALKNCGIENFTKWINVQGKGETSGPHFADEIWPGENSVIFTAIEDNKSKDLLKCIKDLRIKLGKEGIKAFSWGLEEIT